MIKKKLFFSFLFFLFLKFEVSAQSTSINLNFESVENNSPTNWKLLSQDNFQISTDSVVFRNGHFSAKIKSLIDEKYRGILMKLPQNIQGKTLTFSGYIKSDGIGLNYIAPYVNVTENVAFNSFDLSKTKNSGNWEPFNFSIALSPNRTSSIELGVYLKGVGTIWIDDFKIVVDKSEDLKYIPFRNFLASNDTLFNTTSTINKIILSKNNIENIKQLGLIWGFTKYYHPNIAKGDFNFDFQLFRVLKNVLKVNSKKESEITVLNWLKSLGNFEIGNSQIQLENVKYFPDLDWIETEISSPGLKQYLRKIKSAKKLDENYYFGFDPNNKNPIFYNESNYENMKYSDAGYKVLALFRYWNTINYFFPYKKLIEENWENVLEEFIPKIVNVKSQDEYFKTILSLICKINDSHAIIWDSDNTLSKFLGQRAVPLIISNIENKPVVSGFYSQGNNLKNSFQKGDVLLKFGKKRISDISKQIIPYVPASNYSGLMRDVYRNILRTDSLKARIEFLRGNKKMFMDVETINFSEINVAEDPMEADSAFKLLPNNIAYIRNSTLKIEDLPTVWSKIKNTMGLIIDNRNYPKTFHYYDFCNYLFSKETDFVKFSYNTLESPGLYKIKEGFKIGKTCDSCYNGKVVVLVNEITQSASEFQSMAYRSLAGTTIFGSTTAGADGNLSTINLPGYIVTTMSGVGVYFPDGRDTQRVGIIPDIVVKPTIFGLRNNKDEVLAKSQYYLKKLIRESLNK